MTKMASVMAAALLIRNFNTISSLFEEFARMPELDENDSKRIVKNAKKHLINILLDKD